MYFAHLSAAFGLLFAVVSTAILLGKGNNNFFPGGLLLLAFVVSPYVLLTLAARFGSYPCVKIGSFVVLFITGTLCTLAFADFAYSIWSKPSYDAQSALIFVALPILQIFVSVVSVCLLFAFGAWLERRKEKGANRSAPSSDR